MGNSWIKETHLPQQTKNISDKMKQFLALLACVALCSAAPGGHGYWRQRYHGHHPHMKAAAAPAAGGRTAPLGNVVEVAKAAGSFSTLLKVVTDLGLAGVLTDAAAVTVFAPSDEAFAKLPAGTLESLTPEQATAIIARHVVTATVPAAAVQTGSVATYGGEEIGLVKTLKDSPALTVFAPTDDAFNKLPAGTL